MEKYYLKNKNKCFFLIMFLLSVCRYVILLLKFIWAGERKIDGPNNTVHKQLKKMVKNWSAWENNNQKNKKP